MTNTTLPDPDRPSSGRRLPDPDRPSSPHLTVDDAWESIQQAMKSLRDWSREHVAVLDEIGTNPILASRVAVGQNLSVVTATVERYKSDVAPERLSSLGDIVRKVQAFFTQTGDTAWLEATANAWRDDIAKELSGRAPWFTLDGLAADNSWSGPAATAYYSHLPRQQAAMQGALQVALGITGHLETISAAIKRFWLGITNAFGQAAGAFAKMLAGLFGVDTLLNPGEKIGEIIKILVDLFLKIVEEFFEASEDFRRAISALETEQIKQSAFPVPAGGGRRSWPMPGLPISTDKDDWTPQP